MARPHFSALNLARSSDSSAPSTPKSSHIANLPPESPTSPFAPRSPSPVGRTSQTPSSSRAPSQLRIRDSRPPYLPFRRISLPPAPNQKRDSIASIFTVDSVKEHEESGGPAQPAGQVSTSLPTESSMPDLGLPPPPPIPAARTPLSSSPSRRVVILAPPSTSDTPATPSRVRPRPMSSQSLAKSSNQSPGRLVPAASRHNRRPNAPRPIAEEKSREREEKRRRVAKELMNTEQSYVDGLDLVYNHFLAPLIESLATAPHPLVTPADLGVIFPGFIDILNFNRSFLSELRSTLTPYLVPRSVPIPIPGSNPSSTSLASQPVTIPSASSRPSIPNEAGSFVPHEPSTSWNSRLHLTSESQASLQLAGSAIGFPVDDSSSIHARAPSTASENAEPALLPNLASVLAQHVPYLRLYKPFVTGFPASMERLAKLSANEPFRIWLKEREKDPACGMLGLRSWLLSIVQRCPRYLLLVKDLEKHTDETDEGHTELSSVLELLTKITNTLNTSLADHTAMLALLDLQRNTSSLPPGFSFVAPGRSLVRRGRLRISGQEVSQAGVMRRATGAEGEREVLVFSDCVVWLERELEWGMVSASSAAGWASAANGSKSGDSGSGGKPGVVRHSTAALGLGRPTQALRRPTMGRTRSKSEAELPTLKSQGMGLGTKPETLRAISGSSSAFVSRGTPPKRETPKRPPPKPLSTMEGSISSEERWRFRGMANLMDVEVVVSPRNAMQIDFLSPEGSFALYASTYDQREEWINAIRSSKATLLATFNVTHPDSTLTSSSSTTHLRRALQALPYPPGEATIRAAREPVTPRKSILGGRSRLRRREPAVVEDNEDADTENSQPCRTAIAKQSNSEKQKERRGRVEHYVPPIWVPDREAPVCMRCQAAFGWRRRRHHCRICGRVVCASCSSKNFFVMDPSNPDTSKSRKPERACTLCYEAVFPVVDSSAESINSSAERGGTIMPSRQSPARPRILEHLISTTPITTPAIERPQTAGLTASPPSPTMLTPSSTAPSETMLLSPSSSKSGPDSSASGPARMITTSTTERTITSLDSQRTVQPHLSMASDLSSFTSNSQSPSSRPRSLDVGRRLAAASAFVHTAGVTARSKVIGKGKGRRVSLRAGGRERESRAPSIPPANRQDSIATLGRGAAAQQLNELLGRSPI
ncbi:unnamed protein product [Rhizoctonia solani]|uniref:Uncharacterized protein n=1 Tax=Rhizoctonia solani TaxID=456999 RepID=A0A8H3CWY2_9AGAM|nr:unnamed protein product [Rhizoctonia solani]